MRQLAPSLALLFGLLASAPVPAEESFTGKVVAVHDGDSLTVLRAAGREMRVHLYGADAPELEQPHGSTARQFVVERLLGQEITVRPWEARRQGETLAEVRYSGGLSLAEELVRTGYGWWSHRDAPTERRLAEAEIDARAKRLGLWADERPVPPWTFTGSAASAPASSAPASPPPAGPAPAGPVPAAPPASAPAATGPLYATKSGSKYHTAGCRSLARTRIPITLAEAEAKGLAPCGICKP